MKKIILKSSVISISTAMLLAMTGCSGGSNDDTLDRLFSQPQINKQRDFLYV